MRFIFLAPLILAACAQQHDANAGFQAVYLYGNATAEIHAQERCARYENLSDDVLIPALAVPGWDVPREVEGHGGTTLLKVLPC